MKLDETERLRALADYRVLDTPEEEVFDNIAKLTARIFRTPISLVTLVDEHRQWFKAHHGLALEETPREYSFCDHAIRADAPLVVPDATADARFASNPLVTGDPRIRFYCGVPLRTSEGHGLGTLCLIDRVPRQIEPRELALLEMLARQVEVELEIRRRLGMLAEALKSAREDQRTRELLAAMIVHDMRNPLTIITMLASSIAPGDRASEENLQALLAEAERLRRMLADALDVRLHDFGGMKLRKSVFLAAVPAQTVAGRMSRIGQVLAHHVSVEVPDESLLLDADPEFVTRVLENLVSNAVQHAPQPGPITIAFRRGPSGRALGEVRDQNPQIPEADRSRIFEPLEQGAPSSQHRGHGLGLTFCRLAIAAHGGSIAMLPGDNGLGNRVVFDLPLARPSDAPVARGS